MEAKTREVDQKLLDKAHDLLAGGRLIAFRKAPYFQTILHSFVPREAPGYGTWGIAQNGILLWDPLWTAALTVEQIGGLWLHEAMHRFNRHAERRGTRDPRLWNYAGDLAINSALIEMGCQLPPDGFFPKKLGFPEGLMADEYYELLLKNPPPSNTGAGKGKGQGQAKASGSAQGSEGEGEGEGGGQDADHDHDGGGDPKEGGDAPKAGGGWCGSCAGRPHPNEPRADDPDGRTQGEIDRACRQTAESIQHHASKGIGKIPSSLRRYAEETMAPPKVPWQQKLGVITRSVVAFTIGAVDHRYDAPSRRQAGIGYGVGRPVLPRLRKPVPNVAIVVDTSGSMGGEEIEECLTECNGILKAVGANVTFVACDAAVHEMKPIATVKDAMKLLKGGGGTDFRPAFNALKKLRPAPHIVAFMTDGYGPAPDVAPPGMKTIWLLVGGNDKAPASWGETIVIEREEKRR